VWVDGKTGALLRTASAVLDEGSGAIPTTVEYSQPRTLAGVQLPTKNVSTNTPSGRTILEITAIDRLTGDPEKAFAVAP
jgi:hypothetical protein